MGKIDLEVVVPKHGIRTMPQVKITKQGFLSFNRAYLNQCEVDPDKIQAIRVNRKKGSREKVMYLELLKGQPKDSIPVTPTSKNPDNSGIQANLNSTLVEFGYTPAKEGMRSFEVEVVQSGTVNYFKLDLTVLSDNDEEDTQ